MRIRRAALVSLGVIMLCSCATVAPSPSAVSQSTRVEQIRGSLEAGKWQEVVQQTETLLDRATLRDVPALGGIADDIAALFTEPALALSERVLERSLALQRAATHVDEAAVGETLSRLATLDYYRGEWESAERRELAALAYHERAFGEQHTRTRQSLYDIGLILFLQARYQEAAQWFDRAENGAADPILRARILNGLGELRRVQNDFEAAEIVLRKALQLATDENEPHLAAIIQNNLAGVFKDRGRYDETERYLLPIVEPIMADPDAHDTLDVADAALNLAELYRLQGRYSLAEPLYRQAAAAAEVALGAESRDMLWFYNQWAALYRESGQPHLARPLYDHSLEIAEATISKSHPLYAQLHHDFGNFLREIGDVAGSRRSYAIAIEAREHSLGTSHPEVALTLVELALLEEATGSPAETRLPLVDRALQILADTPAFPDAEAVALTIRAKSLREQGANRDAMTTLESAIEQIEAMRPHRGGGDATIAHFLDRNLQSYDLMIDWLVEESDLEEAFRYSERSRARTLLDRLQAIEWQSTPAASSARTDTNELLEKELKRAVAESEHRYASLREDLSERDPDRLTKLKEAWLQTERDLAALDRLYVEQQRAGRTAELESTSASVARNLLSEDETLLVYEVGVSQSYLFVLPRRGPLSVQHLVLDASAASILGVNPGPLTEDSLGRLIFGTEERAGVLGFLQRPRWSDAADEILRAAFHTLMPEGVWNAVRNNDLVIVPDGALHLMPFEALVPAAGEFWIDHGPIVRYLPSATVGTVIEERTQRERPPSLLLISAMSESVANGRPESSRLPGVTGEIEAIIRIAKGARTESIHQASEASVRRALESNPTHLHFATHAVAYSLGDAPSATIFLQPPPEITTIDDDGRLQLFEIYRLRLNSDLTVLSACQTGSGRAIAGEGPFTLARAFLAAGSNRVIASVWPVDDDATATLMGELYARLAIGESVTAANHAAALRSARLMVRNRAEWSAPLYWAPFVLTGAR